MDKYEIISQVGEGSFGQVYKARRRIDGQIVALKIIRKSGKSVQELKSLQRECKIQRHLNHPNIIRMLDSFETEYEVVVITEYAKNQLYEILARNGRLSEERAQVIACDLVSALYYLHSNRILHRDLKPQNVLLDNNGVSKLCDFGFARIMSSEVHVLTSVKGTPLYMAPELIEEYPYDHNVDLWSLGCIIYELLTGVPPFPTSSIVQLIHFIRHQTIKWPTFISSNCRSFLQGLLQKDSKVRLTWPNLLYHPFVKERVLIITENVLLAKNNFPSTNKICTGYCTNQDNKMQEKDKSSIINNQLQNRQKEFYDTHNMNCAIMQDCSHCSDIYSEKFIPNKTKITNCASKTENFYNYNCHNYLYNNACENSTKLVKVLSEISSKSQNIVANAKKNEELDSICKIKKSQNCKLSNTTQEIVNEEWLAFLQRSMEEIMDGEIESLLQENCVIVFVSPLSNSTVSCKVIEYISCLLALPFVLSIKKEDRENIQDIYLQAKVIPNLVCAMKTIIGNCNETNLNLSEGSDFTSEFPREKVQALEASTVLLCRLIYMQEKFVVQFCSSIFSSSEVILFSSLLNLESGKSRIVADLIAVLIRVLQTQGENSNIVEKILLKFQRKGIIRLLTKLLTHHQKVLRLRTCNLICLLAKFKCTTLQQIWGEYIRNLLENLTNDDMDVQAAAVETLKELQRLSYFHEELQAA